MLDLRPFSYSEPDYRRAIAINAAVFGEPLDPLSEWQHADRTRDPAYPFYRDLVLRRGTIIAYVDTYQGRFAYHPRKFACLIYVDPRHDSQDVRPFVLAQTLRRLGKRDLVAITSGMLDSIPEAMRFFDDYGFRRVALEKLSKLDISRFDADRYADHLDRVKASGIEIVPLRQLQSSDPDWQKKLYDLEVATSLDIPSTGEKHYPAFDEWLKMRLESPTFDPDAWFIALDAGAYVAHSEGSINRESRPVQLNTGVTATRRAHRRRGIATALKLYVIRYAHSQGVQEIFTSNDSKNPMYLINLALGFQPLPSWVRVEKDLSKNASER